MSRYINYDAIDYRNDKMHGKSSDFIDGVIYMAQRIEEAPSIDIVFCKECKYEPICTHSVQHTTHEPTSVTIGYKSVEWCSYGERKDKCKECWYWSEVHKRCENKCGCQFKPYGERKETDHE